ncbi:MAG: hypothetical protein ACPGLV_11270 [Bacteroidia bacterium]
MLKSWLLFFGVIIISTNAKANDFTFTPELIKAYNNTFRGKFNKSYIALNKKENAANGAAFYFLGYNNFLKTVFSENPQLDKNLIDSHEVLIDNIEDLQNHAFKKYAIAELYMQQSMIELRMGNYVSGMLGLRKSYSLVEKNLNKYPDFQLSKKTLYVLQALLSNVPDQYKSWVELFGYKTDQYIALSELDQLQKALKLNNDYGFFRHEIEIYRGVLMHKLTDKYDDAYSIIKAQTTDFKENPVSCFIRGKIALDSKKTGEAIEILKHFGGAKCPFPYINYDLANAYLYSLNKQCVTYFAYFIKQNKSEGLLNDSYLRIARWAHVKGNNDLKTKWLAFINPNTKSNRERDKLALNEAKKLEKVHPKLLEAWLTFDGGYYEYSIDILTDNKNNILYSKDGFNTIRYYYLLARLHQDMNNYNKAVTYFESVIQLEFNNTEYFIPLSCYNTALIYENKLFKKTLAIEYYKKCTSYKNYPYASSYKYKSELAIERLKKQE